MGVYAEIFMKIICPNCGKVLDKETAVQNPKTLRCPRCGNTPFLEDSQIITISGGEVRGPGLRNFQEKEKEMVIHGGMVAEARVEESVIEAKSALQGEHKGSPPHGGDSISTAPMPPKLQEATVEEQSGAIEFEWKAKPKDPGFHQAKAVTTKKNKQPVIAVQARPVGNPPAKPIQAAERAQTMAKVEHTQRKPTAPNVKRAKKRIYPWYYFALFYGIPGILVFLLIVLTIMYYYRSTSNGKVILELSTPQKIWDEATMTQREAYVYYREALESKEKQAMLGKSRKSVELYLKALQLGDQAWNAYIHFLMERHKLNEQEAEKYAQAQLEYGYKLKIRGWQEEYRKAQELLQKP